jgi:magnesium-transporting ATPase (P-type)
MEREKILRELFRDIIEKPDNLDNQIMQKIYREAGQKKYLSESDRRWWNIIYLTTAILTVAVLIYSFGFISFQNNSLIWIMLAGLALPLIVDSLISNKIKKYRKENSLSV